MSATSEDLAKLLVRIELSQAKTEKQAAAIAKAAEKSAKQIDNSYAAANSNVARGFDSTGRKVVASLGAQKAAAQNLSFQLNDIATQLASGASPFRVLAQQSGQVVQALNQAGGAAGAIRAIGGAFGSVLNPVGLATLAIGGLTAAAYEYFSSTDEEAEKAKPKLEEHLSLVKRVVESWGAGAPPALVEYVDQIERLAAQKDRIAGLQQAQDALLQKNRDATADIVKETEKLFGIYDDFPQLAGQIEPAREVLKKLSEDGKISREEAELLIAALSKLTIPGARSLIDEINKIKNELVDATRAANDLADAKQNALSGLGPLGELGSVTSEGGQFGVAGSGHGFKSVAVQAGDSMAAAFIKKFEGFRPGAYWDVNAHRAGFGSDTTTDASGNVSSITSQSVVTLADANRDLARRITEFQNSIVNAIGADTWASFTDEQQAALTSITYNYGDLPDRIVAAIRGGGNVSDAIRGLGSDNGGINRNRRNAEADAFGGGTITAAQSASASAQQAADAWGGLRKATVAASAETKAITSEYQAFGQIAQTALSGIANALADGKIEGKELLQILMQVVQQLLTMPAGPGGGGIGGFLSGILGSIFHKGGVVGGPAPQRAVSPSTFAGAKRYHTGGVAGLMPGEVPAILQRGEVVLPKGTRSGGGSETINIQLQADPSVIAQIADQRVQTAAGTIVQVSVQQSQKAAKASFGGWAADHQVRRG